MQNAATFLSCKKRHFYIETTTKATTKAFYKQSETDEVNFLTLLLSPIKLLSSISENKEKI